MERLDLTKEQVIEKFKNGVVVKKCSGLWNNPLTNNRIVQSEQDIISFYQWANMVEVKKYPNDNALYLHGYSDCDMF